MRVSVTTRQQLFVLIVKHPHLTAVRTLIQHVTEERNVRAHFTATRLGRQTDKQTDNSRVGNKMMTNSTVEYTAASVCTWVYGTAEFLNVVVYYLKTEDLKMTRASGGNIGESCFPLSWSIENPLVP